MIAALVLPPAAKDDVLEVPSLRHLLTPRQGVAVRSRALLKEEAVPLLCLPRRLLSILPHLHCVPSPSPQALSLYPEQLLWRRLCVGRRPRGAAVPHLRLRQVIRWGRQLAAESPVQRGGRPRSSSSSRIAGQVLLPNGPQGGGALS